MGNIRTQCQQADTNIFLWIQRKFCKKRHTPFVRFISATGDGWCYPLVAVVALSLDYDGNLNFFYCCLFAYAMQVPLYILLKHKFKRNRPEDYLESFEAKIKPSDQFSFPSGHTAAAIVMATQILLFFPWFAAIAIFWALAIGASRVLLGVHFPGDILAGASIGVLTSLLSFEIIQLINI